MSLPANDPYEDGTPSITSIDEVEVCGGRTWTLKLIGSNFSAWCELYEYCQGYATRYYADKICMVQGTVALPFTSQKNSMYMMMNLENETCGPDGPYYYIAIKNPLTYTRQTPPHIILGVAHWHCGIPEASIDVDSFDDVHTWCGTQPFDLERTVVFRGENTLDIIKALCEQSRHVYIYVTGTQKLACGYLDNEPALGGGADWILGESNLIRVEKYEPIRGRKIPGSIVFGYNVLYITPGEPEFERYQQDNSGVDFEADNVLDSPYEAKYVDSGDQDQGTYDDLSEYLLLEVEVGRIGFLMDIDETVEVRLPHMGLSIDSDYPDVFRIHKIKHNVMKRTARLTMIKRNSWNTDEEI